MARQYLIAAPLTKLFTDPKQFKSIFFGSIYIGNVDEDPLNPTHQQQIYVVDESNVKTPVEQPIPIGSGGYAEYNGYPAKFVCDNPYSIVVLDKVGAEKWRVPDVRDVDVQQSRHNDFLGREDPGSHDAGAIVGVTRTFKTISDMILNKSKIPFLVDQAVKVQGENELFTNFVVVNSESDVDLGGGLWAKKLDVDSDIVSELKVNHDVITGVSLSNEALNIILSMANVGKSDSSIRFGSGAITVNTHLGGDDWREIILTNSGDVSPGVETPYKVTNEKIYKSAGWQAAKDATEVGTWSTFSSGSTVYVGHELKQSNSAGNTLTWVFTSKGDFALGFTGDTDGGIVEVTVDNGDPIDIDTYTPTPNEYRQFTTFATNQDNTKHTVVVKSTNRKNIASSGTQANITSLRILGGNIAPYSKLYQPKPWVSGDTVRDWEEVQGPLGGFYNCNKGGVTGGVPPIHKSGSVSDGSVTWTYQGVRSSFSSESQLISVAGSEREYKYDVQPVGQSGYDDVGGNLHGNEYLNNAPVYLVGGVETDISDGRNYSGSSVAIQQKITDFYGPYSSKIDVADVVQIHEFKAGVLDISASFTPIVDYDRKTSYACMWPYLTYDAINYVKNFETMGTPRATIALKDFEGIAQGSPNKGNKKDFYMEAIGRVYPKKGSAGVPTSDNGKTGLRIALKPRSLEVQSYSRSDLNAGMAPNVNGGAYTGYSSWLSKMYIQDVGETPQRHVSGETYKIGGSYFVEIYSNDKNIGSL